MTEIQTHCRLCDDSGWVWSRDQYGVPYCQECSCGIRKKTIHRNQLKFAEIPGIYKDAMFNNFRSAVYQLPESQETVSYTHLDVYKRQHL